VEEGHAGLSAGRVQSVATRLVVDRERERMAFVPRPTGI
jgi:DNA topoisomerase-1